MSLAPGITVNGTRIFVAQIDAEARHHPAGNPAESRYLAMQALVIRELLLQEVLKTGTGTEEEVKTDPEGMIDRLLEQEIEVPTPLPEDLKRYYESHRDRFFSSPLVEAAHILYLAPPQDEEERKKAQAKAQAALKRIQADPSCFGGVAAAESACPSGKMGGNLGQLMRGQTLPAFEAALMQMEEGEISAQPVETEVGYHLIRVDRRIKGQPLPFEAIAEKIGAYLQESCWNRAFSQYIQRLAQAAEISGFIMKKASSPLVQ